MSAVVRLGTAAGAVAMGAAGIAVCDAVDKRYPSTLNVPPLKSEVVLKGQTKYVIGYTGHHESAFKEIAKRKKDLYFARPATAQHYALRNGGATASRAAAPTMGMVVADQPVSFVNPHGLHDCIVFKPVTPAEQRALRVKVVNLMPVTDENRVGATASFLRMKLDIKARGVVPVLKELLPASIVHAMTVVNKAFSS